MTPRFIVVEVEGWLAPGPVSTNRDLCLSCHILDTAWAYALVASYRTESIRGFSKAHARALIREQAAARAAELEKACGWARH